MRAALLAIAACGGAAGTGPAHPKEEAIDPDVASKGAKDLVEELYDDVGHGNTDSLQSLLDPKLMVLGPRRGDAVANRSDAILALSRWADAKKKLKPTLKSNTLGVYPSAGGHSAWGCDTIEANGQHWAVMVVMSGTNDLWSLDGVMLGDTPGEAEVKAALKKDAVVPPAAGVTVKASDDVAPIVERFTKGLADQQAFAADMASADDAVVIGPAHGEVAKGKKDVAAYWKKRLKANARAAVAGEVSGAATKDGMLAWVSAPIMRAEDGADAMPLRAFAVFRRAGDSWKLIGLQEAVALDAPGAGAPFKKFTPAAIKKTEEPAEEQKPAKKEKPAKKVAAKKKPAADDDDDKPVKKAVKKKPASDDDDDADKQDRRHHGFGGGADDNDVPSKRFKKKPAADDGDDDDAPKKVVKKKKPAADDGDDDAPKKIVKKKPAADDDDDDAPKKVVKKKKPAADDDEDDDAPKKKKKAKKSDDDE